ncbi:MAG: hypothetical protein V9E82_01885 [Candidatus Nanopelagicales bacterium]|jgi:hypothetical protein
MLDSLKQRVLDADLPDPVFAVLGAVDLAVKVPGAAGRYYGDLVERGHARLVEVGTQRAVRKRVSSRVETGASRVAVRYKQRQRRTRKRDSKSLHP